MRIKFLIIPIFLSALVFGQNNVCFNKSVNSPLGGYSYPTHIAVGDLNSDGIKDIVAPHNATGSISVFLGSLSGSFSTSLVASPFGTISGYDAQIADVNNDGKNDVVVASPNSGIDVYIGDGLGGLITPPVNYANLLGGQPWNLFAKDFNHDGNIDFVTTVNAGFPGRVEMYLGDGTGDFSSITSYTINSTNVDEAVCEDFNNDGNYDLAVSYGSMQIMTTMFSDNNGILGAPNIYNLSGNTPSGISAGDFNSDGFKDIVVSINSEINVMLNDGLGNFANGYPIPGFSSNVLTVGDFNNDAFLDVLCGTNDITTFFGNGAGSFPGFAYQNLAIANTSFLQIVPADFNNDGKIDFATANSSNFSTSHVFINSTLPSFSVVANEDTICSGNEVMLVANGGVSYNWQGLGTNDTVYNVPLSDTSYVVIGTDVKGCSNTDTFNVKVNQLPTVSITGQNLTCPGYQVLLNATGANTYSWDNGDLTQTTLVTPLGNETYTVTGVDTNQCVGIATFVVTTLTTPTPEICMVTVDDPGDNNIIYWDKTNYGMTDTFFVYREITNGNFQIIGKVPYDSLSQFVDTVRTQYFPNTGDPRSFSYKYKLAIKDTCGNLGAMSLYHGTMFLQDQLNGNFNWTHYEIEGQTAPVSQLTSYVFLRDNDLDFIYETTIGTTTNNLATDSQYSTYQFSADWRIETNWSISCTPTMRLANGGNDNDVQTTRVKSKSNVRNNRSIGIKSDPSINSGFKVYPNPAKELLNIEFLIQKEKEATIIIENMLGQVVYEDVTFKTNNLVNVKEFTSGIYFVKVKTSSGVLIERVVID